MDSQGGGNVCFCPVIVYIPVAYSHTCMPDMVDKFMPFTNTIEEVVMTLVNSTVRTFKVISYSPDKALSIHTCTSRALG